MDDKLADQQQKHEAKGPNCGVGELCSLAFAKPRVFTIHPPKPSSEPVHVELPRASGAHEESARQITRGADSMLFGNEQPRRSPASYSQELSARRLNQKGSGQPAVLANSIAFSMPIIVIRRCGVCQHESVPENRGASSLRAPTAAPRRAASPATASARALRISMAALAAPWVD